MEQNLVELNFYCSALNSNNQRYVSCSDSNFFNMNPAFSFRSKSLFIIKTSIVSNKIFSKCKISSSIRVYIVDVLRNYLLFKNEIIEETQYCTLRTRIHDIQTHNNT